MGTGQVFTRALRQKTCRAGVFSVVVGLYDDVHVLIEGDEEAQKALHGELAEVAAQHLETSGCGCEQGSGLKRARMYCLRALDWRTIFH